MPGVYSSNDTSCARDPLLSLIPDGGDATASNQSNIATDNYEVHGANRRFEVSRGDEGYMDPYGYPL